MNLFAGFVNDCEVEVQNHSVAHKSDGTPCLASDPSSAKIIEGITGVGTKEDDMVAVETEEHVYEDCPLQSRDACTKVNLVECAASPSKSSPMEFKGMNDRHVILSTAVESERCLEISSNKFDQEIILAENLNIECAQVEFEAQFKEEQHFNCKITFHCRYAKICQEILKCLNDGEIDALSQNTQFGDLIRCGRDFNISGQIIWYMVIRQSNVSKSNEFWMVVNERPVRFSKMEFALLTGLRFARDEQQFPDSDSFKNTHFKGQTTVKSNDILERMQLLKKKKVNERSVSMPLVQLAALYFAAGVLCPSWLLSDSVDSNIMMLASDWEAFRSFPWGNIAYNFLLRNLKKDMRDKVQKVTNKTASPTHSIGGFVYPLQVLAYECIPGIAKRYVERKVGQGLPLARMCRWSSGKWNQKKCPTYAAIRSAAEASEDIISCLIPTEEENAAIYIRDGAFDDDWPDTVTQHISDLLLQGMKVFCTSTPTHAPPSTSHASPIPSPSRPSSPPTSHSLPLSPRSHPHPSPPPSHEKTHLSTSTSTSIILRELCKYMDAKFESMEVRIDARLAQFSNEIKKVKIVCDKIKKKQRKATQPLKRLTKASDGVMKRRRKYIDIHEDENVAKSSHMA